jgi:hypothetical protein
MKNNIDCKKQISQKQSLLKNEIKLPQDIKEATTALKFSTEEMQTANKRTKNKENIH